MPDAADPAGNLEERRAWMGLLARASAEELERAWRGLDPAPAYRVLRAAESGLVLVRGRVGGGGTAFNLGEMTMTRCAVRLDADADAGRAGFAFVAGRGTRRAELAAVFDALMQGSVWRAAVDATVLQPVARRLAERRRSRAAEVAATKVDFLTMVRERDNA